MTDVRWSEATIGARQRRDVIGSYLPAAEGLSPVGPRFSDRLRRGRAPAGGAPLHDIGDRFNRPPRT
jgi:hypothetical protein